MPHAAINDALVGWNGGQTAVQTSQKTFGFDVGVSLGQAAMHHHSLCQTLFGEWITRLLEAAAHIKSNI